MFARTQLHAAVLRRAETADSSPACVAFSGGADSLALLLTVVALWPERRGKLTALHFNHRLRGAESDGDEAFCRELCASLGIALRVGAWAEAQADASEAEAREARQAFFKREMDALDARVLFTGHHQDDVAETMLMRLARGSGAAGLAAPRPVQTLADGRVFLRPLLTLTKAEIVAALQAAGRSWREDASNAAPDFFRNRIRREVLPAWRAAAENDALAGAALSRELLEEDDAALERWLAELLPAETWTAHRLDLRALAGKPRALWRRALRRWLCTAGLARSGFEELLAICERGEGQVSAGEGVVELRAGVLSFSPGETSPTFGDAAASNWAEAVTLPVGEGTHLALPNAASVSARTVIFSEALREKICAGGVDPAREVFLASAAPEMLARLGVRRWRAGDRYQPLGAPGSAKLQDLFVNRKILPARRHTLPVVCGEAGDILWVPGFPPAEKWKVSRDSVAGVHLTYEIGTCTVHS